MNRVKKIIAVLIIIICFLTLAIGTISVVYVLKPARNNTESEMIEITATDGISLFAAETIQDSESHKWALLIHSYRSSHRFMNPYATEYQAHGYNTVQPDNRAHGRSGGKWIGMGYLDQFDILCWIHYILEKDPDAEIVLHGVSMGASALMMLSGQEGLPRNIKVIIADSGYTSATDYLTWKLKQRFHLPPFPVIPIANISFKIAAGYFMNDASAIEAIKKSRIPTLIIHGEDDQTVPVADAYRLAEAAACKTDLFIVAGAGHGEAVRVAPRDYWNKTWLFIQVN